MSDESKEEKPKLNVDVSGMLADLFAASDRQAQQEMEARRNQTLPDIIVPSHLQEFIATIPESDRTEAIKRASNKREQFLTTLWEKERKKLTPGFVETHQLTSDLHGWEQYLRVGFEKEDTRRKRFGFEDWSKKYLSQMLYDVVDDEYAVEQGLHHSTKIKASFFDYYFADAGLHPEIWRSSPESIDHNSLLVHSLGETTLEKVIASGVLGLRGRSAVAFCQDRVVYDSGYIVAFQANELVTAGYPLLRINEDSRDAEILKEWRSPMPVDIHLARLVTPTSVIPDRWNASRISIATSFFGEEYLRQIPRLK
ncbi:hypothetical protein HY468_05405 [Candidatus Roizmanbacteria bacterium]|nr:hypothetical protein [Candidatus Roizmanbacteria bacterium]